MRSVAFTIPSDFSHVALVTRCVITLAGHVTGEESGAFETAVGEALNNVIEHSYGAGASEPIHVELAFDADSLTLIIEDGGEGMDPALFDQVPDSFPAPPVDAPEQLPEGGFGLTLIKMACDELSYERHAGGNRLTMTRHRHLAQAGNDG